MFKDFSLFFKKYSEDIFIDGEPNKGYWSNLSKKENFELINDLNQNTTKEIIKKKKSILFDMIFSEQRAIGLELLKLKGNENLIDFGCMWGALTIPASKQVKSVLGVDQTIESLIFSSKRAKEENLSNIKFLNADIRKVNLPNIFDIAIINGVLEWIPETQEVDLTNYFKNPIKKHKRESDSPIQMQKAFLKKTYNCLNDDGKLYLAIENRYDYKYFIGVKDPHSQTYFSTIFPKKLVNIYFKIFKNKEYNTWIYSFRKTKEIVESMGFIDIKVYSSWPDYHFPEQIFEYGHMDNNFKLPKIRRDGKIKFKLLVKRFFELFLFKIFKLDFFAPAIIIVAKK